MWLMQPAIKWTLPTACGPPPLFTRGRIPSWFATSRANRLSGPRIRDGPRWQPSGLRLCGGLPRRNRRREPWASGSGRSGRAAAWARLQAALIAPITAVFAHLRGLSGHYTLIAGAVGPRATAAPSPAAAPATAAAPALLTFLIHRVCFFFSNCHRSWRLHLRGRCGTPTASRGAPE